ncbi:MAG: hypothetical protein NTU95_07940 [Methanothrix sp.]|nr:hypothetical protein [Methanothrix sp.]
MTERTEELEAAAKDIDPASLQAAKAAIAASCQEYIRWAKLFSERLETVEAAKLHKFARAFGLTLLGHLPTRPGTCPFCIQYDRDKSCTGCGYAATHGRCDADDSAFSLFIEAFLELGRLIFQDTGTSEPGCQPVEAKRLLFALLQASSELASRMREDLPSFSTLQLMEQKQIYIDGMIELLPLCLFSEDAGKQCRLLQNRLKRYW